MVEVELRVENRKPMPLPWLEVNDEFPQGLSVIGRQLLPSPRIGRATLRQTLAVSAYQRVRRRYRLLAVERGVFHFGPTVIRTSDPFALLTAEQERDSVATLVAYPLAPSIERLGPAPLTPFGVSRSHLRLLEDPLRVSGVREYLPGDEPRRIHWKATARMGTLQSKLYDPSTRHTLIIFLDLRIWPGANTATDGELTELAISTAASVTAWAQTQGYAVGLCANGAPDSIGSAEGESAALQRAGERLLRLAPSANPRQLGVTLDALARLQTLRPARMDALLDYERARIGVGATAVYIGAQTALDDGTLAALRRIQARGHPLTLLLTAADADGDAPASEALAGLDWRIIGGRSLWRKLQREALGDEMSARLARGAVPAFIAMSAERVGSRQ